MSIITIISFSDCGAKNDEAGHMVHRLVTLISTFRSESGKHRVKVHSEQRANATIVDLALQAPSIAACVPRRVGELRRLYKNSGCSEFGGPTGIYLASPRFWVSSVV